MDSYIASSRNMVVFLAMLIATFLGWSLYVWIFGGGGTPLEVVNNSPIPITDVRVLVGEDDVETVFSPIEPGQRATLDINPESGLPVGLEYTYDGQMCAWQGGFVRASKTPYRMLVEDCTMVRFRLAE